MAAAATPPPISVSVSTTTADPPIATPVSTPAFRAFINRVSSSVQQAFSQRRPWSELVDRTQFAKPESFSDATLRLRKNVSYFRVNYLTILAAILAISLISHPFSLLLLLALLAAWLFLWLFRPSDQPLVAFGRTFSDRETLCILIVVSVVVVFLTSVGYVLISALLAGVAVACVHGAFRMPEDLFLDEQEGSANGFLSFIGGAPFTPGVASRI